MQRKNIIIASSVGLAALACILLILFNSNWFKHAAQSGSPGTKVADSRENGNGTSDKGSQGTDESNTGSSASGDAQTLSASGIAKSVDITVQNNSLEYDLKVTLNKSNSSITFLRFEYYMDGAVTENDLDQQQIPGLEGMFERRSSTGNSSDGYGIKAVYLNAVYSRAYFTVEGASSGKDAQTSLYSVDLKDFSLKKLFSGKGTSTGLFFSKNYKYLAFSCSGPSIREGSLLQIIKCESNDPAVSGNMDAKGVPIGGLNTDSGYGYTFVAWYSSNIAKLEIGTFPGGTGSHGSGVEKQTGLLYDVSRNVFLNAGAGMGIQAGIAPKKVEDASKQAGNTPGQTENTLKPGKGTSEQTGNTREQGGNAPEKSSTSQAQGGGTSGQTGNTQGQGGNTAEKGVNSQSQNKIAQNQDEASQKTGESTSLQEESASRTQTGQTSANNESDPVKTLRSFYDYLAAGQYVKAYDLLDDKFVLNAFDLSSSGGLTKRDIDLESFTQTYGELFKAAKFMGVVAEKADGADSSTVYYYQDFSLKEGEHMLQPLAVTLGKTGKGWRIVTVNDGNMDEYPFNQ